MAFKVVSGGLKTQESGSYKVVSGGKKDNNIISRFKEHPFLSTLTPYGLTGIQDFGEITKKAPDISVDVLPHLLPPVEPFKSAETSFRKELLAAPANIGLAPINYILPAASKVAKFQLLKGGLNQVGKKMAKAGYGTGKVNIPVEAIKQTAKETSLTKSAIFRAKAATLKVKPKFQIGEAVPTTEKGIQAILPKSVTGPTPQAISAILPKVPITKPIGEGVQPTPKLEPKVVSKIVSKYPQKIVDQKSLQEVGSAIAKDMGITEPIKFEFKERKSFGITGTHYKASPPSHIPGRSPFRPQTLIRIRKGMPWKDTTGKLRPPSQGKIKGLLVHELVHALPEMKAERVKGVMHPKDFYNRQAEERAMRLFDIQQRIGSLGKEGKISTEFFTNPIEGARKIIEPVKNIVQHPISKQLTQDIEDVQLKGARHAGEAIFITDGFSDIKNANEALAVSDLLEGKPTNIDPKILPRLQQAAQRLKEASDLMSAKAQKAGVRIQRVDSEGKKTWVPFVPVKGYLPRVINKDVGEALQGGMKDLYATISQLKNAGVKDNIKQAVLNIKEKGNPYVVRLFEFLQEKNMKATPSTILRMANRILNKEYVGSYGHLERPRTADELPPEFYERRANLVFLEYFERAGKRIAEIEQWGQTNKKMLQNFRNLGKINPEEFKLVKDLYTRYSERHVGGIQEELSNLVSISKIGLGSSEIENLTQLLVSTMPKVGLINSVKGVARAIFYMPTKVRISKTGLPFDNIIKEILGYSHHTTLGKVNDFLLNIKGFVGINRANAIFSASMIESFIKDTLLPATKSHIPLMGKLRSQWAYDNLRQLNIQAKDVVNGKISEEKLIEAMLKGAREYQLFSDITNEPLWLSDPKFRALTVLKRFGIKQPMMVFHKIIYDELKHANPLPILRFLVMGAIGGSFVIWAKKKLWEIGTGMTRKVTGTRVQEPDWITKWDAQDRSTFENILDLLAQAGATGMMAQLFEKPENIDFLIKPVLVGEAQRAWKIGRTITKKTETHGRRTRNVPWETRRNKAAKQAIQAFPLSKYFLGK